RPCSGEEWVPRRRCPRSRWPHRSQNRHRTLLTAIATLYAAISWRLKCQIDRSGLRITAPRICEPGCRSAVIGRHPFVTGLPLCAALREPFPCSSRTTAVHATIACVAEMTPWLPAHAEWTDASGTVWTRARPHPDRRIFAASAGTPDRDTCTQMFLFRATLRIRAAGFSTPAREDGRFQSGVLVAGRLPRQEMFRQTTSSASHEIESGVVVDFVLQALARVGSGCSAEQFGQKRADEAVVLTGWKSGGSS